MFRHHSTGGKSVVRDLTESQFLIVRLPILNQSELELGLELTQYWDFEDDNNANDFDGQVLAGQFANKTAYLGYELTTNIGIEYERKVFVRKTETSTMAFVSVYAGLGN